MGLGLLILGVMGIVAVIGGIIFIWFLLTFVLPKVFTELKLITSLYYKAEYVEAVKRHLAHFLLFLFPFFIMVLFSFGKSESILYAILMALFLLSGFFGLYIFAYFLYALSEDNGKKMLVSTFIGGFIALIFLPSGYFTLKPIYEYMTSQHYKESRMYDACHDKEDWLVGGECTSRSLTIHDIIGEWKMLPTRDAKESKEGYFFYLNKNGTIDFHAYSLVTKYGSYDYIKHVDSNGTWSFHLKGKGLVASSYNPDIRHPYVEIKLDKAEKSFILRFNSKYGKTLYLQNQYDDFDAPYYLTYQHIEMKKREDNKTISNK